MVDLVGYRFQPNPEELVSHFLKKRKLDPTFSDPKIKELNIYKYHPCELPGLASIQSDEQVWYFFCILDQKYAKSERPSRTAKGGSWKKTGIDRQVKAKDSNKQIGIKKTLVFYKGSNTRKENKTNWTMHEYHEYPCKKNSPFKGEVVVCRIEKKPDKKREPSSSSLDEGQPSDSLAYDSGNNVANNNLVEVESHPLSNHHISNVTKDIIQELEPQLLPNQHVSSNGEDHVAKSIFPESESQLLPKQHVPPIIGDHVAKALMSQSESQSHLPNFHRSSTIEDHLTNNSFSELEPRLLPNQHMSSAFEDYVAQSSFFEIESLLQENLHLSSDVENHAAKSFPSEVQPLVPAQRDELIDCYHNSFSTLHSAIYPAPGSSYSGSFSNDLADHNPFSALRSPIHLPPGCSYSSSFSNNSTNGLQSLNNAQPGSSYFSNGFDYNSFSALQFPTHPLPESSYSTNGLDHNAASALQSPVYPQPGSSYLSSFSNESIVWTPQVATEQKDDLAYSHALETGHTFAPDFNSSKAVAGGHVGDGNDAASETISAWPNEYFPMANGEYHFASTFG